MCRILFNSERGTHCGPLLILPMLPNDETIARVHTMLEPLLDGTDLFVIAIRIKPTNNIKLFMDSDSGLTVEKIASINRRLRAAIEAEGMYPEGDYSLEVSSPGIDEPLSSMRQYHKNVGRTLEVTPVEGEPVTGVLKAVTEEELTLDVKIPKKRETKEVTIPLSTVKTAVVQVVF